MGVVSSHGAPGGFQDHCVYLFHHLAINRPEQIIAPVWLTKRLADYVDELRGLLNTQPSFLGRPARNGTGLYDRKRYLRPHQFAPVGPFCFTSIHVPRSLANKNAGDRLRIVASLPAGSSVPGSIPRSSRAARRSRLVMGRTHVLMSRKMKPSKPKTEKTVASKVDVGIIEEPRIKTGPVADRVKLAGDWEKNVGIALAKKRSKAGWPKA
jgi:hypothetical protein